MLGASPCQVLCKPLRKEKPWPNGSVCWVTKPHRPSPGLGGLGSSSMSKSLIPQAGILASRQSSCAHHYCSSLRPPIAHICERCAAASQQLSVGMVGVPSPQLASGKGGKDLPTAQALPLGLHSLWRVPMCCRSAARSRHLGRWSRQGGRVCTRAAWPGRLTALPVGMVGVC